MSRGADHCDPVAAAAGWLFGGEGEDPKSAPPGKRFYVLLPPGRAERREGGIRSPECICVNVFEFRIPSKRVRALLFMPTWTADSKSCTCWYV
jgi:hypothetical protein